MRKQMPIVSEIEGRQWCEEYGYKYCGTRIHPDYGYIMEYEDNTSHRLISEADEEYYLKKYEQELKKQSESKEVWIIASDDGFNSRMFRSKSKSRKDCYTFELSEAGLYSKAEAQKTAALMTQRSSTGRIWFGQRIK